MGIPLLAIPESMLPRLLEVLAVDGIRAEQKPVGRNDDPAHFLMSVAISDENVSLCVSVQREPHVNPEGPILVLFSPKSWGFLPNLKYRRKTAELNNRVIECLIRNGARVPVPRKKPFPQNRPTTRSRRAGRRSVVMALERS